MIYSADGARSAILGQDNTLIFKGGTVDFSPEHQLLAGNSTDNLFPPNVAKAGSVGIRITVRLPVLKMLVEISIMHRS